MSGTDRDTLAAEFALGTLDARTAAAVAQAMPDDPALAAAVLAWEGRLAPLAGLAPPEAPPAGLWDRIERAITRDRAQPRSTWRRRVPALWAAGATALAAGLGAFIVGGGADRPPMMTVLLSDRAESAWTAEVGRDGAIHLAAIPPVAGAGRPVPEDRVLQLWALPPGAAGPTSLGLLARGQRSVTVPAPPVRPVPGMLIEISQEPPGGSPLGRPSGPVLFIGRLSQPGPPT